MNAILYMLFFQVDICLNLPNPRIFCVHGYHIVNPPLIPALPRVARRTLKKHSPSQGCAFLILSLFLIFFPVVVELDQSDAAPGTGLLI